MPKVKIGYVPYSSATGVSTWVSTNGLVKNHSQKTFYETIILSTCSFMKKNKGSAMRNDDWEPNQIGENTTHY